LFIITSKKCESVSQSAENADTQNTLKIKISNRTTGFCKIVLALVTSLNVTLHMYKIVSLFRAGA